VLRSALTVKSFELTELQNKLKENYRQRDEQVTDLHIVQNKVKEQNELKEQRPYTTMYYIHRTPSTAIAIVRPHNAGSQCGASSMGGAVPVAAQREICH
jgi:hypothetical protein